MFRFLSSSCTIGEEKREREPSKHPGGQGRRQVAAPASSMQSTMEDPLDAVPLSMAPANLPAGPEERDRLLIKGILNDCVTAFTAGHVAAANAALMKLSGVASPGGRPLQRVAFAIGEALSRRVHELRPLPPPESIAAARLKFGELYPLLGVVAAAAANHAILQVMEGEMDVHVVDLGVANPIQMLELLRLFAARPGGAPHLLRLTLVTDQDAILTSSERILTEEAARLQLHPHQFVFNPVRSHIDQFSNANIAALGVQRGQALAITSSLQLHRLIADVINIEPPPNQDHDKKGKRKQPTGPAATYTRQITKADALLRVLRDLSPKVMLLTEQEADHNCTDLRDRISNAIDYYVALFGDLETGAGAAGDLAAVEWILLRDEIMDIVARDGTERRERHEKMVRWAPRMRDAGFKPVQVRFDVYRETARLAHQLSGPGEGKQRLYRVVKNNGCFFLYSGMTLIFAVSVWQPARSIGK